MALSLLVWAMAGLMSVMAFDSGVSTAAIVLVGLLLAYPLMLLLCSVMSWAAYGKGKPMAATIWTTLPIIIVAAGGIALQIHG